MTTKAAAADLRELDRVADRVRVVGPRLAAREQVLIRIRGALQDLADLAAVAEGRPLIPVPELPPHVLADQLQVLGQDALTAPGVDPAVVCAILARVRGAV